MQTRYEELQDDMRGLIEMKPEMMRMEEAEALEDAITDLAKELEAYEFIELAIEALEQKAERAEKGLERTLRSIEVAEDSYPENLPIFEEAKSQKTAKIDKIYKAIESFEIKLNTKP